MQKRGFTAAGTQRWFCRYCHLSVVRKRKDIHSRSLILHFTHWITGVSELRHVACQVGYTRKHLSHLFRPLWSLPAPQPSALPHHGDILIVDGVYLSGRVNAALVGHTGEGVILWSFCEREDKEAWTQFFAQVTSLRVVVMDGQKGLYEAVQGKFPQIIIQRCLVHVERFVRTCTSTRPKTEAGRELWRLIRSIWDVHTPHHAQVWTQSFLTWSRTYDSFLKERTYTSIGKEWWYTHRNLRRAKAHIINALPHLFTFTKDSSVPRTTNHVEGGVNSRLKELRRRHRGLSSERKRIMAAYYFQSKKPPRKVT